MGIHLDECEEAISEQETAERHPLQKGAQHHLQDTSKDGPHISISSESDPLHGFANRHLENESGSRASPEEIEFSISRGTVTSEDPQVTLSRRPSKDGGDRRQEDATDGWCEDETARAIKREESVPPLFVSIQTGSVKEVASLLDQHPYIVNNPMYGGSAPIHAACHKRDIQILQILLFHGAKVEALDSLGDTPLHLSVQDTWHEGVQELLQRGASPNTKNVPPATVKEVMVETPLHAAIRRQDMPSVMMMMQHQPDLGLLDSNNRSMLHLAAQTRNMELVKWLLSEPTCQLRRESRDKEGRSAIHAALSEECDDESELKVVELIKILVRSVEDVNVVNYAGETPLFLALRSGLREVAECLVSLGADLTILTKRGQSVLHAACISGCSDSLKTLLEKDEVKSMITLVDYENIRPFDCAIKSCSTGCCYLLLANGERLANTKDGESNCKLVLDHLPSSLNLLKNIFDSHVHLSEKAQYDSDFSVTYDYSALLSEEKEAIQCSVVSELIASPLEDLIKHPLVESFLYVKWCRIQRFFYANVALYSLFLILHTCFVVLTYGNHPINWQDNLTSLWIFRVAHIILFIMLLTPIVVMMIANHKYIRQVETAVRLLAFVSCSIVVFSPNVCCVLSDETVTQENNITKLDVPGKVQMTVERQTAAVSVFFTWVGFMMLLGRYPFLGSYILMFAGVSKSMTKFLASFMFLIFGFTFSFHVLFLDIPVFETLPLAFTKTLMMISGEIAFSEFVLAMEVPFIGLVFLCLYLFLVAVLLANLLIGLAVNDIPNLQNKGRIHRLAKQASYLVAYERLLLVAEKLSFVPRRLVRIAADKCRIRTKVEIFSNKKDNIVTRKNLREAMKLRKQSDSSDDESEDGSCARTPRREEINEVKGKLDELTKCCLETQQQIKIMHQQLLSMQLQHQQNQKEKNKYASQSSILESIDSASIR